MQHKPLSVVQHRIKIGAPLPFSILGPDGQLLLNKGQVIQSEAQLEAMLERHALVDRGEADSGQKDPKSADKNALPGLWGQTLDQIGRMLRSSVHADFLGALDEVAAPLRALIERDPDLAIFQVLRQEGMAEGQYGSQHGVHAAITALLAAKRLGASEDEQQRTLRAALTMNLSVLELQGRLTAQVFPLHPRQKLIMREHPWRSREMLVAHGIDDAEWLRAVLEHHEAPDGSGYPKALTAPSDLALLLSSADVFTAKLSTRAGRVALPADRAARDFFISRKTLPAASAIIKEFGVFPPGTLVKLASGESGVVVRRAQPAPIVAALVNKSGEMMNPARRDGSKPEQAIVAVLAAGSLKVRLPPEKLMLVAALI
jgi:AraC-like DNA-binding protein